MSMRNPLGGSGKGYTLFPGQAILCFRVPAALDIASGLHATRSWREDGEADKVQEEEKREQELRLEEEGGGGVRQGSSSSWSSVQKKPGCKKAQAHCHVHRSLAARVAATRTVPNGVSSRGRCPAHPAPVEVGTLPVQPLKPQHPWGALCMQSQRCQGDAFIRVSGPFYCL